MKVKIKQVMSEVFGIQITDINDESSPENIEKWDSLKHMQLILALEDEFAITFPDESIAQLLNVESIYQSVKDITLITD